MKLEICVGADGRVHEAALRSSASARLDPVVLAAAKTWQYRPRLVDGKPAPFCHGVVISTNAGEFPSRLCLPPRMTRG